MRVSVSLKSFLVFLLLFFSIIGLTALSSPGFYVLIGTALLAADKMHMHCAQQAAKFLVFPAEHHSATAQTELAALYLTGEGVPKDWVQARKWFEMAAEQGEVHAQDALASTYLWDFSAGSNRNDKEALKWLNKAASQGSTDSLLELSNMYYFGRGTAPDIKKACAYWKKAAGYDDASAQDELGRFYEAVKDDRAMATWNEKAAKQGWPAAQFRYAENFFTGRGIKQDQAEGCHWLTQSASHGNLQAQSLAGVIYFLHLAGTNDDQSAKRWLSSAADQGSSASKYLISNFNALGDKSERLKHLQQKAQNGNAHAQQILSQLSATGCGVPHDDQASLAWRTKAATNGDADAQFKTGYNLYDGIVAGAPDFKGAAEWLKKSADSGNSDSEYVLSKMFLRGAGVPTDPDRSLKLLTKAAESGNADAQLELGSLYIGGLLLVPQDEEKAKKWLTAAANKGDARAENALADVSVMNDRMKWRELAAKQGFGPAVYHLARAYAIGVMVEKKEDQGNAMLEQLAKDGNQEAIMTLATNSRFGLFGTKTDESRAKELYQQLAEEGNIEAQLKLGEMYSLGKDKDRDEACKWFKMAADQGSREGASKLKRYSGKGNLFGAQDFE